MLRHSNITVPLTDQTPFLRNSPLSSPPRFLTCPGQFTSRPLNRRQYERHVHLPASHVPARRPRSRPKKGTTARGHRSEDAKSIPSLRGFKRFGCSSYRNLFFYISPYLRVTTTEHAEHSTHYLPNTTKRG